MSRPRSLILVGGLILLCLALPVPAARAALGTEDYVDATSNLHDPTDLGTHSSFAELQDYDGSFDTLTEANTGGGTTAIDVQMKQDETNTTSALTGYKCKLSHVFTPVTAGYYLIVAMATGKTSSTSGACYIRLYVAGTGYSEGIIYVANAYQYMTFCAIKRLSLSGSTNISLCFRSSSTSYTASVWDARIFATNATVEQYAEAETRTTDAVISSWTNKSSITVTPATTGDYWILADGIFDGSSGTYSTFYRVVTKNLTVMVDCLREMQNAAARFSLGFSRVIHLTSGTSDNVVVQFDTENVGNTAGANWVHIAALRIDQFKTTYYVESASEYTPAGAGTWYDTVTKTYTPNAGSHLVIGCLNEKSGSTTAATGYVQTRLNLGSGTDLKDTDKWLSKDTSDYMAFFKFYNRTLAASSRTDALQYLGGSTSARVKTPRLLVIELIGATLPNNYELDLEVGWTAADYDETSEELCLFASTQDAEALEVDLWTGSWTLVIADVAAGMWNNVSIASYLTDATVEIRFVDTTKVSDTVQSAWLVEAVLLHTWTVSNTAPINDAAPSCTNLDDTDNLYARAKLYEFACSAQDDNGYADLDYVELSAYSGAALWTVRFDEDTHAFTEEAGASYIALDGSSTHSHSGIDLDVTFALYIEWAHTNVADYDLRQYVVDSAAASDTDDYDVNYDYETRTDFTVGPAVTDGSGTVDRGDIAMTTITLSGTVIYYAGTVHPLAATVDVWISSTIAGGPWEATTYADAGTFSRASLPSDATVGTDDFTVKVVQQGAGSGGADESHATHAVAYISDRVQVQGYTMTDGRIDINTACAGTVTLLYDYDNAVLTDGTVTVNDITATYSGANGIWAFGETKATVQQVTYNLVAVAGNVHGITTEDQNGQSRTCVWDRIYGSVDLAANDTRDNINEYVAITVTLLYDYDEAPLTDGTVTIEGSAATHLGSGVWRIECTSAAVILLTYDAITATGGFYGITVVQDYGAVGVIWDRIEVYYDALNATEVNVNEYIEFRARARLDYDDTELGASDTLTANFGALTWDAVNAWFEGSRTQSEAGDYIFTVASGADATYGITALYVSAGDPTGTWILPGGGDGDGGGGGGGGGGTTLTLPPLLIPINGVIAFVFLIVGFRLLTNRRRSR